VSGRPLAPIASYAGIQVAETPGAQQPIARSCAQLTGFVGRCLRGPLDLPVIVRSFADFHRHFGGLWQPSPLSYAVEHFFEQGGQQAVIVRVANGAQPVTLSLDCGRERLVLEARAPGTREFLRASVDYGQIDPSDTRRFNLVVQRVRVPGSERVEEQETFRGLTIEPTAAQFVTIALRESVLVRVRGEVPSVRPRRTLMPGTNLPVGYVSSGPDGDDGRSVSDYDVIGSAARRSGLFALSDVDELAFVHIPPLTRTSDVGISTLLVAARFCRERHAILIVDPPLGWGVATDVARALESLVLRSDNAVMFYPRIAATDRLRGCTEVFGNQWRRGGGPAVAFGGCGLGGAGVTGARAPAARRHPAGPRGQRRGSLAVCSPRCERPADDTARGAGASASAHSGVRCERFFGLVLPGTAASCIVYDRCDRAWHALVRRWRPRRGRRLVAGDPAGPLFSG